jgi:hypothetical protein
MNALMADDAIAARPTAQVISVIPNPN